MIQQRIREGIHRATFTRRIAARAFLPLGSSSYTATVPGGAGRIYVRPDTHVSGMPYEARDMIGLSSPTDDNAPVWIEPDADGTWMVTARRYE